jgi:hypothetical protein
MFGFEQDYDYFGDYNQIGRGWDDEEEEYEETGEICGYVEEYIPDEHDCLVGG